MNPHHEHEFEAMPGLPEALPRDEHVVWQGVPSASLLAVHVFHLRKLIAYFAFMLMIQILYLMGEPGADVWPSVGLSAVLALVCIMLLAAVSWYTARNTRYTLTNRRVVMRIGIVLTITLNLPLKQIRSASVRMLKGGAGDLALGLGGSRRLGWLHLWPHARAWHIRHPEPTLRCIQEVGSLSDVFLQVWVAENPLASVQWGDSLDATVLPTTAHQPAAQVS